jgi:hypothetical protein
MEAKVDPCFSGLIIGRRRYELAGFECLDRKITQVTNTTPVVDIRRKPTGLITPELTEMYESATGKLGAGSPESLLCR